jgi:hypothetical protein
MSLLPLPAPQGNGMQLWVTSYRKNLPDLIFGFFICKSKQDVYVLMRQAVK